MIIAKVYIQKEGNKEYLICELAKKGIPLEHCNVKDEDDLSTCGGAYITPPSLVGISKEAKEALINKINREKDYENDIFFPDFTFETQDYQPNSGTFGYTSIEDNGDTLRKKVLDLSKTINVDTSRLWLALLNDMSEFPNSFLQSLNLDFPYEGSPL